MDKIIELAYELKSLIDNDERVVSLSKLENIMANDEEAIRCSYKKDLAVDNYEFAISHFDKDSTEVNKAQKELHEAKLNLDNVKSVKDYLLAYSKVRDLYMEINNLLFSFYKEKNNTCGEVK